MNVTDIMLSERRQTQVNNYSMNHVFKIQKQANLIYALKMEAMG